MKKNIKTLVIGLLAVLVILLGSLTLYYYKRLELIKHRTQQSGQLEQPCQEGSLMSMSRFNFQWCPERYKTTV